MLASVKRLFTSVQLLFPPFQASAGFDRPLDFSSFFSSGFSAAPAGGGSEGNFFEVKASSEVKPFTLPLGALGSPFQEQLQGRLGLSNTWHGRSVGG